MALAGLGLQTVLVGYDEVAQTVHHVVEHVRGHDAITQQFLLTRGPHGSHLFASLKWHADIGCSLEAIDMTMCYITQEESSKGHTVGLEVGRSGKQGVQTLIRHITARFGGGEKVLRPFATSGRLPFTIEALIRSLALLRIFTGKASGRERGLSWPSKQVSLLVEGP